MSFDEIRIALEAAHVMADHFQEPVYLISDLSVKRGQERKPEDKVLEIINPREVWVA